MTTDLLREFGSYPSLLGKLIRAKNDVCPQKVSYGPQKDQYLLHFAPRGRAEEKVLRYLKRRKVRCGKVIVVGSSAGAHLGALLCYDDSLQKRMGIDPGRLCGFAGLGGPYYFEKEHSALLRRLMKDLFPVCRERDGRTQDGQKKEGEPYRKLRTGQTLPMLVIHGRRDGLVSYQNATAFYEKASGLGIPAKFHTVPSGRDSHSAYAAGSFLEDRKDCATLDLLFHWIEKR